jgi:predicted flap endonuclease-1-like 5' DNA nuclease
MGPPAPGAAERALRDARKHLEDGLAANPDWVALRRLDAMPGIAADANYRRRLAEDVARSPLHRALVKLDEALAHLADAASRDGRPTAAALALRIPTLQLNEPRDELARLPGITEAVARRLAAAGITRFSQLAALTETDRAGLAGRLGLPADFFGGDIVEAAHRLEDEKAERADRSTSEPTPVLKTVSGYQPGGSATIEVTTISLDDIIGRIRRGSRSHRPIPILPRSDAAADAALPPEPITTAAAVPGPIEPALVNAPPALASIPIPPAPTVSASAGDVAAIIDDVLGARRDADTPASLPVVSPRILAAEAPSGASEPMIEEVTHRLDQVEAEIEVITAAPPPPPAANTVPVEPPNVAGPQPAMPAAAAVVEPLLDIGEADVEIVVRPAADPEVTLEPLPELPFGMRRFAGVADTIDIVAEGGSPSFVHADEASVVIVSRPQKESAIPTLAFYAEHLLPDGTKAVRREGGPGRQ